MTARKSIVGIYALTDRGGSVRYIGQSKDIERRYRQYREGRGHSPALSLWLNGVARAPGLIILEACDRTHLNNRERWWINQARRLGHALLNGMEGGGATTRDLPGPSWGQGCVYLRGHVWWMQYYDRGKPVRRSSLSRNREYAEGLLKAITHERRRVAVPSIACPMCGTALVNVLKSA